MIRKREVKKEEIQQYLYLRLILIHIINFSLLVQNEATKVYELLAICMRNDMGGVLLKRNDLDLAIFGKV